jgi:hypothetical protein
LATLVFACSHKAAARTAFPQAERIGAKVTEAEMKKFLAFLPPQLALALSAQPRHQGSLLSRFA